MRSALPPDRDPLLRHVLSLSDVEQVEMLRRQLGGESDAEAVATNDTERRPLAGRVFEDGNALVYESPCYGGRETDLKADDRSATVMVAHKVALQPKRYKDKQSMWARGLRESLVTVEPMQGFFTMSLGVPLRDWTPDYIERLLPRLLEYVPIAPLYQERNSTRVWDVRAGTHWRGEPHPGSPGFLEPAYWTELPDPHINDGGCFVLCCRRYIASFDAWIFISAADVNHACRQWLENHTRAHHLRCGARGPAPSVPAAPAPEVSGNDDDDLDALEKAARRSLHGNKAIPPSSNDSGSAPPPKRRDVNTEDDLADVIICANRLEPGRLRLLRQIARNLAGLQ